MLRALVTTTLLFIVYGTYAQFRIEVKVAAVNDAIITRKMERATVAIVESINSAFSSNSIPLNPDNTLIDNAAFESILSLWEVSSFKVTENQILEEGLVLSTGGYQIRNIPIYIKEDIDPDQEREIAFTYDKTGKIIDCFLCLSRHAWRSFFGSSNSVTEMRRRQIILDFVEKFRTAYNTKDTVLLSKVFSEDALIITGKIIKQIPSAGRDMMGASNIPLETVKLVKSSKAKYLAKLKSTFDANQYIKVDFDSIEITQGKQDKGIYGVTLRQSWNTPGYSDKGWLFLIIDFKDEDSPLIYVRTWQPGILNDKHFPRKDVFRMTDFNIEK